MLLIPAIDIINGACVRLTKGDFKRKKIYSQSPVEVAKKFVKQGAPMLHLVDLDGAKTGMPLNRDTILAIRKAVTVPLQVGGGIRSLQSARRYLQADIDRIIIGTKATEDSGFLEKLIMEFGAGKVIVSVDVKNNTIAMRGWKKTTKEGVDSFLAKLRNRGVRQIIVTDVLRDGTLKNVNIELFQKIIGSGFEVIAAGGIATLDDIRKLRTSGAAGAILGKALYENTFSLTDAIAESKKVSLSNLTKRIIPCLDVKNGRVVKGINFENLKDAGDPVELGKKYFQQGADELVFLDISASKEKRKTMIDIVRKIAQQIFIPFTVGGGITTIDEIRNLLAAGADKVSINTAAVLNPNLIQKASRIFGSQCIVVAIDVKKTPRGARVFIKGGTEATKLKPLFWAKQVEKLGAGEILLTSMDADGAQNGFDLELLQKISAAVSIPVIASGGAGSLPDFKNVFTQGKADAALAASLFHYNRFSIRQVKEYLQSSNIPVRL